MSTFRERILSKLQDELGLDEDALAKQLLGVVKGEHITTITDGRGNLKEKRVTVAPADAARGLILLDSLTGGELGLTPKQIHIAKPQERMYGQWAPAVDNRIVHGKKQLVEVIPEPPPEPTVEEIMVEIATGDF